MAEALFLSGYLALGRTIDSVGHHFHLILMGYKAYACGYSAIGPVCDCLYEVLRIAELTLIEWVQAV